MQTNMQMSHMSLWGVWIGATVGPNRSAVVCCGGYSMGGRHRTGPYGFLGGSHSGAQGLGTEGKQGGGGKDQPGGMGRGVCEGRHVGEACVMAL